MARATVMGGGKMERKIIRISGKRQVTIPQKYFDALKFNSEAECIFQGGGILIRPVRETGGGEFSEQILADLIGQGFTGAELLERFKQQSQKVRPAMQRLIGEADSIARNGGGLSTAELFGAED